MSHVRRPVVCCLLALALSASSASAVPVSGLTAVHRDGQTFLTWKTPPGTGWRYRVYSSDQPILDAFSLENTLIEGEVGDSTWCDRRLYQLTGVPYAYRIDEDLPVLASDRGLFVVTPQWDRAYYYAVSAPGGYEDFLFVSGQSSLAIPVVETVARPQPVLQRTVTGWFGIVADVYTLWTTNAATPLFDAMSSTAGLPYDCAIVKGQGVQPLVLRGHGRGGNFLVSLAGITPGNWVLSVDDYLPNPDVATFYFGYHEGYDPLCAPVHPLPAAVPARLGGGAVPGGPQPRVRGRQLDGRLDGAVPGAPRPRALRGRLVRGPEGGPLGLR
jgi:hypothetical protein